MIVSEEKKLKQKETLRVTREKRKSQSCKVYNLKVKESSLNNNQKHFLHKVFVEAKWFYNHILSHDNVFDTEIRKDTSVNIKVLDHTENRQIELLSSQMRMGLHVRVGNMIKALFSLKKKGHDVGRLKFKPEINSIDLPQHKVTWNFTTNNKIKIQGLKKPIKVNGFEQIPEGCDFANAKLIKKPTGYYIQVTCFVPLEERIKTNKEVGLDFGIKTSITTSDNEEFNIKVLETKKLKRLQKHFSRKKKSSKNRVKVLRKIKKEYEHISNIKQDKANKIVSYLKREYDIVYIQDELISLWHKGFFGKQVQHSALGAIKSKLKRLESTVVLSSKLPTTKMCYVCGSIEPITLDQRTFKCSCGFEESRDLKAAKTILFMGQKNHGVVDRNSTPAEKKSDSRSSRASSMKQEAKVL